jgi:uncharacterized protein (DUF3820 family)
MAMCLIAVRLLGAQCYDERVQLTQAAVSDRLWQYLRSVDRSAAMKPEDLERLVTQTMPYGKYKGRLIADLPGNYLNWFARVGFPPGEIGQLLALMQEIDHNGLSGLLEPLRRR